MNNDLLELVTYSKDKVSSKKRPTVFIRADDRISKIDPSLINQNFLLKFNEAFQKEVSYYTVNSVRDLADHIKKFNTSLNDTTIVYCNDPETEDKEQTKIAFRLMR